MIRSIEGAAAPFLQPDFLKLLTQRENLLKYVIKMLLNVIKMLLNVIKSLKGVIM